MKKVILRIFLYILIGILLIVVMPYGKDYLYKRCRFSGLAPELPYAEEQSGKLSPVDVYLIPFDDFPVFTANQLANILSKELGLRISVTPAVHVGHERFFDKKRKQYVAELMSEPVVRVARQLYVPSHKTAYIGLLNDDMYPSQAHWRYAFSVHFGSQISVVATGRLVPLWWVFDREKASKLYGVRLLKLVKRAIGEQYFNLPLSADKANIMYGPLLSTNDLDMIGYNFGKTGGQNISPLTPR